MTGTIDPDTVVRLKCLEAVQMLVESHAAVGSVVYGCADDMADDANVLAHFVTNGRDVAFDCADSSRGFVR